MDAQKTKRPPEQRQPTVGSLFAGIGFDLGFEQAGFQTAWQVAIDDTNRLRDRLAAILDGAPREKRLDKDTKSAVIAAIENFDSRKDLKRPL